MVRVGGVRAPGHAGARAAAWRGGRRARDACHGARREGSVVMWSRWGLTLRSARASSIFPPLTPTAARASERTAVRALWLARATWGAPSRARGRTAQHKWFGLRYENLQVFVTRQASQTPAGANEARGGTRRARARARERERERERRRTTACGCVPELFLAPHVTMRACVECGDAPGEAQGGAGLRRKRMRIRTARACAGAQAHVWARRATRRSARRRGPDPLTRACVAGTAATAVAAAAVEECAAAVAARAHSRHVVPPRERVAPPRVRRACSRRCSQRWAWERHVVGMEGDGALHGHPVAHRPRC